MVVLRPRAKEIPKTTTIETVAILFAFGFIAPRTCQSSIGGPSVGCDNSQLCSLSDDLAKKKAAKSRKGTVGKSGNTMPIIAKAMQSRPKPAQMMRIG